MTIYLPVPFFSALLFTVFVCQTHSLNDDVLLYHFRPQTNSSEASTWLYRRVKNKQLLPWREAIQICEQLPDGVVAKVSPRAEDIFMELLEKQGDISTMWIGGREGVMKAVENERSNYLPQNLGESQNSFSDVGNVPAYGITLHCNSFSIGFGIQQKRCTDETIEGILCVQKVSALMTIPAACEPKDKSREYYTFLQKWTSPFESTKKENILYTTAEVCPDGFSWRKVSCTDSGWLETDYCPAVVEDVKPSFDEREYAVGFDPALDYDYYPEYSDDDEELYVKNHKYSGVENVGDSFKIENGDASIIDFDKLNDEQYINDLDQTTYTDTRKKRNVNKNSTLKRKKRQFDDIDYISSIMFEDLKPNERNDNADAGENDKAPRNIPVSETTTVMVEKPTTVTVKMDTTTEPTDGNLVFFSSPSSITNKQPEPTGRLDADGEPKTNTSSQDGEDSGEDKNLDASGTKDKNNEGSGLIFKSEVVPETGKKNSTAKPESDEGSSNSDPNNSINFPNNGNELKFPKTDNENSKSEEKEKSTIDELFDGIINDISNIDGKDKDNSSTERTLITSQTTSATVSNNENEDSDGKDSEPDGNTMKDADVTDSSKNTPDSDENTLKDSDDMDSNINDMNEDTDNIDFNGIVFETEDSSMGGTDNRDSNKKVPETEDSTMKDTNNIDPDEKKSETEESIMKDSDDIDANKKVSETEDSIMEDTDNDYPNEIVFETEDSSMKDTDNNDDNKKVSETEENIMKETDDIDSDKQDVESDGSTLVNPTINGSDTSDVIENDETTMDNINSFKSSLPENEETNSNADGNSENTRDKDSSVVNNSDSENHMNNRNGDDKSNKDTISEKVSETDTDVSEGSNDQEGMNDEGTSKSETKKEENGPIVVQGTKIFNETVKSTIDKIAGDISSNMKNNDMEENDDKMEDNVSDNNTIGKNNLDEVIDAVEEGVEDAKDFIQDTKESIDTNLEKGKQDIEDTVNTVEKTVLQTFDGIKEVFGDEEKKTESTGSDKSNKNDNNQNDESDSKNRENNNADVIDKKDDNNGNAQKEKVDGSSDQSKSVENKESGNAKFDPNKSITSAKDNLTDDNSTDKKDKKSDVSKESKTKNKDDLDPEKQILVSYILRKLFQQ